jgi:putative NADH-flavin reductase
LKPILVDQEIVVEAFETAQRGRSLFHMGEIRDLDGVVLARGRARFVVVGTKEKAN